MEKLINKNTMLVRKAEIMAADMNGATVMMDIETGKYYNLGEVGGVIWETLEEPMHVEALAEKLTREYNVTKEQCLKDILPFLQQLYSRGLVVEEKR